MSALDTPGRGTPNDDEGEATPSIESRRRVGDKPRKRAKSAEELLMEVQAKLMAATEACNLVCDLKMLRELVADIGERQVWPCSDLSHKPFDVPFEVNVKGFSLTGEVYWCCHPGCDTKPAERITLDRVVTVDEVELPVAVTATEQLAEALADLRRRMLGVRR